MIKLVFSKMVASGNDFVVMYPSKQIAQLAKFAKIICDRKYGVGADGLLILSNAGPGSIKMRIFNADGSEAEMCGNGARCAALFAGKKNINIKTLAGIIAARLEQNNVKIRLTEPKGIKLGINLSVNGRALRADFINTGVPHAVILVEGIEKLDVFGIGRLVRYHKEFSPAGTNVDFIEVLNKNSIRVRTYERGVEDETLACGTGSVASALIFALKTDLCNMVKVHTQSGEILKVYFKRKINQFSDVWLEGSAKLVYKGEYRCLKAR
ncbi:MAG: diaminopimelate epimerase [Candidatus Omnitrophica bacterium]|nr:diaminopimelate epimerase [Candidatus Omnitrophota bacterium]